MPTPQELKRYYSDVGPWAESHAERVRKIEVAHARRLRQQKPKTRPPGPRDLLLQAMAPYVPVHEPPPSAKVLDFGCGDGKFLNRLQDAGWATYGIEPSTAVAFLRHRRLIAPPQDGSFDFVFLHHVLEHISDPLGVLRQLAGTLREGGVLFVGVPRLDTLPDHQDLKYCIDGHKHLMCFSELCLTGLLARAGLAVTASLHARELDDALTEGKPLRLRLMATRTATPPPLPAAPLAPALNALRRYASVTGGFTGSALRRLPVRMRAASMDRAREGSRRRHGGR
jgi:SAM-dependent methyltransferase